MRAGSVLINFSVAILVLAVLLNGLLYLQTLASNLRTQIQVFTVYAFTTSVVLLGVVAFARVFKSEF